MNPRTVLLDHRDTIEEALVAYIAVLRIESPYLTNWQHRRARANRIKDVRAALRDLRNLPRESVTFRDIEFGVPA